VCDARDEPNALLLALLGSMCYIRAQERHVGAAKVNVYKSRLCVQMVGWGNEP
jgi:hypothetical protein